KAWWDKNGTSVIVGIAIEAATPATKRRREISNRCRVMISTGRLDAGVAATVPRRPRNKAGRIQDILLRAAC
ncbi:MAG: hypothetical protein JJ992_16325, partial [Planctomycetes bacterium]|nr:hypothetical protein [Planctomycetota bacterium]